MSPDVFEDEGLLTRRLKEAKREASSTGARCSTTDAIDAAHASLETSMDD